MTEKNIFFVFDIMHLAAHLNYTILQYDLSKYIFLKLLDKTEI